MKKVKFLKDHVNGIKKGQVSEFNTGRADYLVRAGVAEYVTDNGVDTEYKQAVVKPKGKVKQAVKQDEPCKTC